VSDPWQTLRDPLQEPTRRHLDQRSRRAVAEFLIRLCSLFVVALWLCLAGAWPLHVAAAMLALAYAFSAVLSMARAMARRDALGRGSLNRWDEALTFVALATLAHLAHGLHA
jgi:Flp pilus assembly protein TadB